MTKNQNKKISTKQLIYSIFCFLCISVYLIMAVYNSYKIQQLKKNGITETGIVNSYSFTKSWRTGKSGGHYSYKAKIKFHLDDSDTIQTFVMNFKPCKEYFENEQITILHDYKNDFCLPIDEIETYKRNKISSNFIAVAGFLVIFILIRLLDSVKVKNQNRNKRIKKLVKKNPELKEKYKKEEKVYDLFLLILIGPFLLIGILIECIKDKFNSKKK